MKTIAAARFEEQCLSLLDSLGPEGIVITRHGRPMARPIPIASRSSALTGALKGMIRIRGDIVPTELAWRAHS